MENAKQLIENGGAVLGIEFGSTRIKAVLIGADHQPIASGAYDWENQLVDGIWTYSLDSVRRGLQACYQKLQADVQNRYQTMIRRLRALGISGMMHGYMPFDADDRLLVPFRTWRNTMTEQASRELTGLFGYPVPQRWSIAHLYQAILNGEDHVGDIRFLTTLAGYIHWQLSGEKVMGIGEAAGMFPIDFAHGCFDAEKIGQFDGQVQSRRYPWKLGELLPAVLCAGESAGVLTEAGARLLDPSGNLQPGAPMCPPEGDAGTGMAATDSVRRRTGNVSAGTSVFAMVVLEKPLSRVYSEIDLVTTPAGDPVAMVHCNNCTSDLNAWAALLKEMAGLAGTEIPMGKVLDLLFEQALAAEEDCGGLFACNYLSGEHITGLEEGRPLFVRRPDSRFTLANFARTQLFTSLGALRIGMDILTEREKVGLDKLLGHGGFFKAREPGQKIMACAMHTPVSVMETAGEGGAWGIALLAAYLAGRQGETLADFLDQSVFAGQREITAAPEESLQKSFDRFMHAYTDGLAVERAAVEHL